MSGRHIAPEDSEPPEGDDAPTRPLLWLLGGLLAVGLVLTAIVVLGDDSNDPDPTTTTEATAPVETTLTTDAVTTTTAVPTTTTEATTTTTTAQTTTTLADPLAALILGEQNIGDIVFGAEPEAVITELSAVLGDPDDDTGWVDSFSAFGTCPGTEARLVRWLSLQAFFTNGSTEWAPEGTRHFFHYSQSAAAGAGEILTLFTDKQISLGSSIDDLEEAYGAQLTVTDDPLFDTLWEVAPSGPGLLWGSASESSSNGLVTSINGGFGCGE